MHIDNMVTRARTYCLKLFITPEINLCVIVIDSDRVSPDDVVSIVYIGAVPEFLKAGGTRSRVVCQPYVVHGAPCSAE